MTIQKGVNPLSYVSGGVIGQYEPVKMGTAANTVIVPTAVTDIVVGVSQLDAVSGANVPVETRPGTVVKMRVGSGTVTGGNAVTIDATDFREIATLTKAGAGTTLRQLIGYVEAPSSKTYAENTYAPVRLALGDTLI